MSGKFKWGVHISALKTAIIVQSGGSEKKELVRIEFEKQHLFQDKSKKPFVCEEKSRSDIVKWDFFCKKLGKAQNIIAKINLVKAQLEAASKLLLLSDSQQVQQQNKHPNSSAATTSIDSKHLDIKLTEGKSPPQQPPPQPLPPLQLDERDQISSGGIYHDGDDTIETVEEGGVDAPASTNNLRGQAKLYRDSLPATAFVTAASTVVSPQIAA